MYRKCSSLNKDYVFETGRQLGKGGYGEVVECKMVRKSDRRVRFSGAMKIFQDNSNTRSGYSESTIREIMVMNKMDHENIIDVKEVVLYKKCPAIVMDRMDGSVADFITTAGRLPIGSQQDVTRQLLAALDHVHARKVVHRDIKPENVLYKRKGERISVRLGDFGIARHVDDSMTPRMMSVTYRAPELASMGQQGDNVYTQAVDVWGAGLVVCELFLGGRINAVAVRNSHNYFTADGGEKFGLYRMWIHGLLERMREAQAPEDLLTLVASMLQLQARDRQTASVLLTAPWLQSAGINYVGTRAELRGCTNDAENLSGYLIDSGFVAAEHTTILREATCAQIVRQIESLARESRTRRLKNVFISFSGHGVSVPDRNGDELDGLDECICPVDYRTAGVISDDILKKLLHTFNKATKITVLMDCCHSGSILDLPFRYVSSKSRSETTGETSVCHPKVVMISGCTDAQTSADTFDSNRREHTGAMTSCFLDAVSHEPEVLNNAYHLTTCMRMLLKERRMGQIPQLSTSIRTSGKPLKFT